jgi:hypothetical protein
MSRAVLIATVSIVLGWSVIGCGAARAESASHPCAVEADAKRRLACYDGAFGAPDTRIQVQAATAKAKEAFGLGAQEKREIHSDAVAPEDVDRIEGLITAVATVGRGERLITLDNKQQWLLVERTIRGPLRAGDRISIRKAALGTHKLITPAGMGLRAKRVR